MPTFYEANLERTTIKRDRVMESLDMEKKYTKFKVDQMILHLSQKLSKDNSFI